MTTTYKTTTKNGHFLISVDVDRVEGEPSDGDRIDIGRSLRSLALAIDDDAADFYLDPTPGGGPRWQAYVHHVETLTAQVRQLESERDGLRMIVTSSQKNLDEALEEILRLKAPASPMPRNAPEITAAGLVVHDLKTWPPYLEALIEGRKTFEVRENDRNYAVGDVLRLLGWNPSTGDYTGRKHTVRVTYVMPGGSFGVAPSHVVMGVTPFALDAAADGPSAEPPPGLTNGTFMVHDEDPREVGYDDAHVAAMMRDATVKRICWPGCQGKCSTPSSGSAPNKLPLPDCPMCDGSGETPYTKQPCTICEELRLFGERVRLATIEECAKALEAKIREDHGSLLRAFSGDRAQMVGVVRALAGPFTSTAPEKKT